MARRDNSPDFIEALARGLDVIRAFGPRPQAMPATGPPALLARQGVKPIGAAMAHVAAVIASTHHPFYYRASTATGRTGRRSRTNGSPRSRRSGKR